MWSAIDTAVLAAEERPHFLMSAPPRVCTAGVNAVSSQAVSTTSVAGLPSILAFTKSGTCPSGRQAGR